MEAVSSYIANGSSSLKIWSSAYSVTATNNNVEQISTKYSTVYRYNPTYDNNSIYRNLTNIENAALYNIRENNSKYGDATIETSIGTYSTTSWNKEYSYFPCLDYPNMLRGGKWDDTTSAGIFAYYGHYSFPDYIIGFRSVITNI